MKVCAIVANGFEELEALGTIALLDRSGIMVDIYGVNDHKVTGKSGITICDLKLMKDLNPDEYDLLLIPGGAHYKILKASAEVSALVMKFKDKKIAAICAGPTILGQLGLLKNRQYTCFTSMNEDFGGEYLNQYVVRDGNFITAISAAASIEFGFAIIEMLQGKEQKEKVQKAIYY